MACPVDEDVLRVAAPGVVGGVNVVFDQLDDAVEEGDDGAEGRFGVQPEVAVHVVYPYAHGALEPLDAKGEEVPRVGRLPHEEGARFG